MKLTREQSQKLLAVRGFWITDACNRCGKLLGSVRWTRRGEPGEWCSRDCRDGINIAALSPRHTRHLRIGAQPAGRPKKHANNAEKCRAYRNRLKNGLTTRNTPSELIENSKVADAKNASHVVAAIPAVVTLETAFSATWPSSKKRTATGTPVTQECAIR